MPYLSDATRKSCHESHDRVLDGLEHFPILRSGSTTSGRPRHAESSRGLKPAARNTKTRNALDAKQQLAPGRRAVVAIICQLVRRVRTVRQERCSSGSASARLCVLCGVAAMLANAGCDPCVPNPCRDQSFCNGEETCSVEGALAVCAPGEPVVCPNAQVCSDELKTCVAVACSSDDDCVDGDICTEDTCIDDACQFAVDCLLAGEGCPCDDGDMCTENDGCDPSLSACVGTPIVCPDGEACDPDTGTCVVQLFACCLPSGMCEVVSAAECTNRVGAAGPPGSNCQTTTCSTGACCLPSGACAIVTQDACGEDEGAYKGDDSTCASFDCLDGACCIPGEICIETDANGCTFEDGSYLGGGTSCQAGTCRADQTGAACCFDGACENVVDEAECTELGGATLPERTNCPQFCPPIGAWMVGVGLAREDVACEDVVIGGGFVTFWPDGWWHQGIPDGAIGVGGTWTASGTSISAASCPRPEDFEPFRQWSRVDLELTWDPIALTFSGTQTTFPFYTEDDENGLTEKTPLVQTICSRQIVDGPSNFVVFDTENWLCHVQCPRLDADIDTLFDEENLACISE